MGVLLLAVTGIAVHRPTAINDIAAWMLRIAPDVGTLQ